MRTKLIASVYWCLVFVGGFLESDVSFSYVNYGRVKIQGKEICSDDSPPDSVANEALCRTKGLKVGLAGRERLNNQSLDTVDIACSVPDVNHCSLTRHPAPCAQVLYLYCDGAVDSIHTGTPTNIYIGTKLANINKTSPSSESPHLTGHHVTKTTQLATTRTLVSYDVHFDFTQAGRVRVKGRQICYDTFSPTAGKALCSSKGFIYASHESSLVYFNFPYVDMICSSANLTSCSLQSPNKYCRNVVYIHCSTHTTLTPMTTTSLPTTTVTKPTNAADIGVRDIFFAFPLGGHVKVKGVELCFDTFKQTAGDILCRAKGLHYNSSSKSFAFDRYRTASFLCVGSMLSSCFIKSDICIEVVAIHCMGPRLNAQSIGCYNRPCLNGGTCHQDTPYDTYRCSCLEDYSGMSCEIFTENITIAHCSNEGWNVKIFLPELRRKYRDLDVNDLYLGDEKTNCTGVLSGDYLVFDKKFEFCQTTEKNSTTGLIYQTVLVYAIHDHQHPFIIREKRFRLSINCSLDFPNGPLPDNNKDFPVLLEYFSDPAFSVGKALERFDAGEEVYVRAYSNTTDNSSSMTLSDCFTSPSANSDPTMVYYIIQNGCTVDPNAVFISQSLSEIRFAFQYFEYAMSKGFTKLHCNAISCSPESSSACQTNCENQGEDQGHRPPA
ncbi:uncharacterized protein LOC111138093 isoform X2 [Crassostrea virginica]|uniref:Uncharacterized protein LOC111138093 isoform X2 n=1 Tax=Crassostrea virginica TaxID=6565 RepID=A0A8B8F039_CRAVI|nr:uncharacterized protein LOC111138093 isoform X2 [Crassostrea virginica]